MKDKKRLMFGHIVNHREPKGTAFVLKAIHQIRMKGYDFGFLFGERLPHDAALDLYRHIDILLEQFIIGWYGAQAVEFMAMGKIVVAYLHPDDLSRCDPELENDLPIIRASPEDLSHKIEQIIQFPEDHLLFIGEMGRKFVEKWHDPQKIAQQALNDYMKAGGKK